MTHENKEILLKYLCMALPYGVNFVLSGSNYNNIYTIKGIDLIATDEGVWDYGVTTKNTEPIEIKYIKPYLRSMSSMTEEEIDEYWSDINLNGPEMPIGEIPSIENIGKCSTIILNWLLENHFDFMGLIPEGLALEAPEGMYNDKK